MIKVKLIFNAFLILNNAFACFFLGLFFLGASNNNGEGAPIISELQVMFKQAIYGFVVSLFFSIITFLIATIFRKKMSFNWKDLIRYFYHQFILLIVIFSLISFFMYLK